MDLEQRVQALEQEVEILKNQIQATLLDIQEQILTNAHPTLRSDNAASASASHPEEHSNPAPIKSFKPSLLEGSSDKPDSSLANVRKVSLDTFQVTTVPDEPVPYAPPAPANPAIHSQPASWSTVEEMEDWVYGKVEKIGAARTRQLIDMYRESGRFEEDVVDTLLQFVDVYSGEANHPFDVEERTRPSPPDWPQAKQVTANGPSAPEPPVSRAAARMPTVAPSAHKPQRPEPRGPAASARAQSATSAPTRMPTDTKPQKAQPKAEVTNPVAQGMPTDGSAAEPDERSTILRLIAGVYNAGAGVKWGKKDG